jgi:hypothetical protein
MSAVDLLYLFLPKILDLLLDQDDLSTIATLCLVSRTTLNIYQATITEHMQVLKQLHHMINVDQDQGFSFHYQGFEMHLTCSNVVHPMYTLRNHVHYQIKIAAHVTPRKESSYNLETTDFYILANMMHCCRRIFPPSGEYPKSFNNPGICSKMYELVGDAKDWGSYTDAMLGAGITTVSGIWNRNGLLTLRLREADEPLRIFRIEGLELGSPPLRSPVRFQIAQESDNVQVQQII